MVVIPREWIASLVLATTVREWMRRKSSNEVFFVFHNCFDMGGEECYRIKLNWFADLFFIKLTITDISSHLVHILIPRVFAQKGRETGVIKKNIL